ncbi:MAG: glutathione transferase GstA [Gammaproteobacteria bacterium]|nr:glutathione transferase GstA [Gammaproteobacteria bacterium]
MKLYSHPGSCSSSVHIALLETGLDFQVIKVNLFGDRKLEDGRNFNDINPKGYVPLLELDNGELLTEISVIMQYIADKQPESGLLAPSGDLRRLRVLEWLSYLNSEVHMTMGLFFKPELEGPMRELATEKLKTRLAFVDEHLATNDYLFGEHFSVADAYLYMITTWPALFSMDISEYKNIAAYQTRIQSRPSVEKALAEIG